VNVRDLRKLISEIERIGGTGAITQDLTDRIVNLLSFEIWKMEKK